MQIQENYRGIIMGTASNEEIIYGKNAVTEALKAEKPIDTVFVLKGAQGMNQIIALAKKQGIVIKDAGEDKLKALCGDKHGGVAAALSAVSYCTVEDILANAESKGKPPFIIICDEIQDPHNLGAIIRTAEAAGADGVIIPKRRSATVNPTVFKTSAGAAAWIKIARGSNLVDTIKKVAEKDTPFLGICLGLQLMFESSDEGPGVKGLGLLPGKILRIPKSGDLKIPHMGWNNIKVKEDSRLFKGLPENPYVYFVHSYYLQADDEDIVAATTEYGVKIHAAVEKDNIFACQFHPEKSSTVGLQILKNFVSL